MLRVTSEVGRLRQVLCHAPGREVDEMIPDMMEELLFDDILHGADAREEHARLRRVLEALDVEVVDAQDLLAEALKGDAARAEAMGLLGAVPPAVQERAKDPDALADMLVGGQRASEGDWEVTGDIEDLYDVRPLPNYCFQRDPQTVIGEHVILCTMSNLARQRESLLAGIIFRHHPRFAGDQILLDPTQLDAAVRRRAGVEGGDLLMLSSNVLAVGLSERTNNAGIRLLADALAQTEGAPRWLVVVEIPQRRAFMHLDTLFTPVDVDACLIYPPVIRAGGALNHGVFLVDLEKKERSFVSRPDLLSTLASLGMDLEPIPCGGDDPVMQQREQWTDGANAMALAPGVVIVYDRNPATLKELKKRGFRFVEAQDLLLDRETLDLDARNRAAILMPSNELSRARGGPHCLLHALVRDPL